MKNNAPHDRVFIIAFLASLFVFALSPVLVRAADITLGAPPFVQQDQDPASFVGALYSYSLTIVAAAAVIMIVYGGVKYVASGGSVSARSDAMDIIKNAIFGVVLLFGAYIILYTINPALVQLKNPAAPTAPDVQTPSAPPSVSGCSSGCPPGQSCVVTDMFGNSSCVATTPDCRTLPCPKGQDCVITGMSGTYACATSSAPSNCHTGGAPCPSGQSCALIDMFGNYGCVTTTQSAF